MGYAKNPIALRIIKIGRRRHEPRRLIVSALATGLVESRLRNLKGGDADSAGWRQERAQYYKNPTNVKASINRYYDEAKTDVPGGASKSNLKKYSVGQISQYIQASAFPGRYSQVAPEARKILKQITKSTGMASGGSPSAPRGRYVPGAPGGATVKTIPGKSFDAERQAAALDLIRHRFDPGAFISYAKQVQGLQDVPTRHIRTSIPGQPGTRASVKSPKTTTKAPLPGKERVGKWEKKYHVPATRLGGTHLYGSAVDIGRKVAKMFGLTVTSTNTGSHVSGSYHYSNRAVDISGSPAAMKKAFKYIQSHVHHGKLTELFYDPIGHYWDNGQKVSGAIGGHSDHVHLAI